MEFLSLLIVVVFLCFAFFLSVVCFMFVSMFLRCCWSDLFPTDSKVVLGAQSVLFSLVLSCGGSASGRSGPLVCFLLFELNRSWFSVGLGSMICFFGILAFL